MRTLVIETATSACSVALTEDGAVVDARHEVVGRGHAERLVPMIAELAGGGRADAVLVDCGPGSFTGIRVGIAAARGLALGWQVPVEGYSALGLLAARARTMLPDQDFAVVMEGGHGEVFVQRFAGTPPRPQAPFASMPPTAALERTRDLPTIGDGVRHLQALAADGRYDALLPRAADAVLLSAMHRGLSPRPIYGRAPDAKLPGGKAPVPA
ncbi:tRNA (adenosine(37)-N6)-threonylcarbamoyltransferase complex dimerization subunit type 1 TsaB [Sphingomonas sp.]